jgi:hypothetical protein
MTQAKPEVSNDDDERLIREVIATYQAASHTGSLDLYRRAFHPSAVVCFPSKDGSLVVQPIEEFAAEVAGLVADGVVVEETARSTAIRVTGAAGCAQVDFVLRIGDEVFEGTDFMSFARLGAGWVITHKLYDMAPVAS